MQKCEVEGTPALSEITKKGKPVSERVLLRLGIDCVVNFLRFRIWFSATLTEIYRE